MVCIGQRAITGVVLALLVSTLTLSPAGATAKSKATTQAIKDEVPVYNAEAKFARAASNLSSNSTGAQVEDAASPFGGAIANLQSKLLDQTWPIATKSDVRQVYLVSSPLIADLATADAITTPSSSSAWVDKTTTDLATWVADVDVVNHDLGLPAFATNASTVAGCEADGATVSTALAAFRAQNPGVTPTETALTGKVDGGPYIRNWPHASHYVYSLTFSGQLRVAAPPESTSLPYDGPSSCADAGV